MDQILVIPQIRNTKFNCKASSNLLLVFFASLGCQPYQKGVIENPKMETPKCERNCSNPDYKIRYQMDKRYGSKVYAISNNETEIRSEIYTNGPVTASFDEYGDFQVAYKSGKILIF